MPDIADPTLCPLCGFPVEPVGAVETHAFLTVRDPLWRYAGRVLHRHCFRDWERRAEFVRKFNVVNEGIAHMNADGEVEERGAS